jgi:hypothetical protein
MSNNGFAQALWNGILNWVNQNSDHFLFKPIPRNQTDEGYDESPLEPHRSYFRLWLVEMFLSNKRKWFTQWYPAVHTSVQLKFGDQDNVKLSHVAQAPGNALSNGVLLNFPVTELVPFNGGVVEVEASLLALKGDSALQSAIGVLQNFSGLVSAPLAQVLTVADVVSNSMQQMINANNGGVHLAMHQAYSAPGQGNSLIPGYFAVILASASQVDAAKLSVKEEQLFLGGNRLTGFDYMLYRLEGRTERDDWRLKNIQEPLDKAIEALIQGEKEKAESFKRMALITAMQSPDLAVYDRRRVALAIKEELDQIADLGLGAVGDEPRNLNQIFAARAMSKTQAVAEGELSFQELMNM